MVGRDIDDCGVLVEQTQPPSLPLPTSLPHLYYERRRAVGGKVVRVPEEGGTVSVVERLCFLGSVGGFVSPKDGEDGPWGAGSDLEKRDDPLVHTRITLTTKEDKATPLKLSDTPVCVYVCECV